ncbi:MAG: DUF2779 domain-containing protein [Bacteroidota bacterium]|nr:DUF2779 domain-containing protein [Bacteroidota bacterium]
MIYLTKSLFLLSNDCQTKLYYKSNNYKSSISDDEFMIGLAEGGVQVGALAKAYYPGGYLVAEINPDEAVQKTNELLQNENVKIYEAAFKYMNCFVRIDILEKKGNEIHLVEVKSKSYKIRKELFTKNGSPKADWKIYFYDLAFQKYVVSNSIDSSFNINAFFLFANKNLRTSINGLNQKFKINNVNGIAFVDPCSLPPGDDLGNQILSLENVTDEITEIVESNDAIFFGKSFKYFIESLQEKLCKNEKIPPILSSTCKKCEYQDNEEQNGFDECWNDVLNEENNKEKLIYNIGGYRKTGDDFNNGFFFIHDLNVSDFPPEPNSSSAIKLDTKQRQILQILSVKENRHIEYVNKGLLKKKFSQWEYPYHLIDFETSRVAIPFHKNKRPYQSIAFQFSHHVINENWNIEHMGEFLKIDSECPNIDFVRSLKDQLDNDAGSVFIYSAYERTILSELKEEINEMNKEELPDKKALIHFIDTLISDESIRKMVDLLAILKETYYDSKLGGSNSLKRVLPVIFKSSNAIEEKYSKPIYGTNTLKSKNFKNKIWVEFDESGKIKDPYKIITKPPEILSEEEAERIFDTAGISNGSTAMLAYSQLQSTDLSENKRKEIETALLQYCELDTFAMVLLLEFYKDKLSEEETVNILCK